MIFMAIKSFDDLKVGLIFFIFFFLIPDFYFANILLLLRPLNVAIFILLKNITSMFIIHHPHFSRDNIFLPVAKFCFCRQGTLSHQYQIAPAGELLWVSSPALYAMAV